MSKKTISINPALFSVTKNKTKKKDKPPPIIQPLISPNILKNKLLERIKKHKLKETEGLDNNKKIEDKNVSKNNLEKPANSYTDEFNDSLSYLQSLSNKKKMDKKRDMINSKTIKRHDSYAMPMPMIDVNLELPEELTTDSFIPMHPAITIKNNDVPYGILKGGSKPTYREYTKTQRNYEVVSPKQALVIDNVNVINSVKSERETRMNRLKEKLLEKKMEKESKIKQPVIENLSIIENANANVNVNESIIDNVNANANMVADNIISNNIISDNKKEEYVDNFTSLNNIEKSKEENIPIKKILKKTIKKKYTLGKSKKNNTVAVLLKNRLTRKKILDAHKEIKKHSINDIKEYLRKHNLIKIGGNAPNDVIRKMYEASMLTGEVTNINKDALLHNFIESEKEAAI
jgi:hypothetical protein